MDLLKKADYIEMPNSARLGNGDTISQNSPNLRFVVQNFGSGAFEEIQDDDDQEKIIRKEFALDIWDFARTLLPNEDIGTRLDHFVNLICSSSPKTRAIHILSLSHIEGFNLRSNMEIWQKLLSLKHFCELTLQINHLVEFAGLIKCVGKRLRKVCIAEMIGERDEPSISSQFEGLDLDEQGALFICQNCPFVEEMDLVSVNFVRKFFFGRQIEAVSGHFDRLCKLAVGKIDWNSLLQIWKLIPYMKDLEIAVIVPIFTLHQQLFEEAKVLTIYDVQELQRLNRIIKNYLETLQVNTFRFATYDAAECFLVEFKSLKSGGNIDTETFNMDERNQMQELVYRLEIEKGLTVSLAEVFDVL